MLVDPRQKTLAMIDFTAAATQDLTPRLFEDTDFGAFLNEFSLYEEDSEFCQVVAAVRNHARELYEKNELPLDQLYMSYDCSLFTFVSADNMKNIKLVVLYDTVTGHYDCKKLI